MPPATGAVDTRRIRPGRDGQAVDEAISQADTTICWRNKTRHMLNHRIMQSRGVIPADFDYNFEDAMPILKLLASEYDKDPLKVVCLRNSRRHRVFNGQVFDAYIDEVRSSNVYARLITDNGAREIVFDATGFRTDLRGYQPPQNSLLFDFGYCLTAHKSQGSEWPWVCVYDDTFRGMGDRARWAYTAATRAQGRLTWCHR